MFMRELSDLDSWLFSAVKDSNSLEAVAAPLARGANVDAFCEEGTPLHVAIKHNKDNIAEKLIDSKASISLVDRNFETAIELAAKNGSHKILSLLLQKRLPFKNETFQIYLQYCVDHYVDRPGQDYDAQNHALIAHYASRLAGVNVGQLLASGVNADKYVVHLYAFRTAHRKNVPLEGWNAEVFLPLRIYSFFEILVKLKKGIIRPMNNNAEIFVMTCSQVEEEILIACEVLRTIRDRLAIKKFNDIMSEKQNSHLNLHIEEKGDDLEESNDDSNQEDDLSTLVDQLYQQLAKSILTRIATLKLGKSYPVSIGFIDHEVYLTAFNHENHILNRVDNLGYGSNRHQADVNNANAVLPFQLCSFVAGEVNEKQDLCDYLVEILKLKDREKVIELKPMSNPSKADSQEEIDERKRRREEQLDIIYNRRLREKYQSFLGQWPQISAAELQQAGNCVLESEQVGLFLRAYNKALFNWLINQERQCVVNNDRIIYAQHASDDKYWREELLGDANINNRIYAFVLRPMPINSILTALFAFWTSLVKKIDDVEEKYYNTVEDRKPKNGPPSLSRFSSLYEQKPILNDDTFSVVSAYLKNDFGILHCISNEIEKSCGENLSKAQYIMLYLYRLPALLFQNQDQSIQEYNGLHTVFEEIKSNNCMTEFFHFVKGIMDLQRAFHYRSTFIFHQAKLSLGLLVNNTDNPLFGFFIYFSLGMCEYHLNNFQDAYGHLKRALAKISLLPNPSSAQQFYKQNCLTCCGYLSLELKKPFEAEKDFNLAYNILFTSTVNSGTAIISPYERTIMPIPQSIKDRRDNIETNVGLAICSHMRASSSKSPQEQKINYEHALAQFKGCLSSINPEIRALIEAKCIEIENELKIFDQPAPNHRSQSGLAALSTMFPDTRGRKRDQAEAECDSAPVPVVQRTSDVKPPK
jgi:hypothetical protein